MKFIQNKKLILLLIFLGIFIFSSLVLAAEERKLLVDWPTLPGGIQLTVDSDVTELVAYFYQWGIALGGLVAFIALIIAGFHYLTSVGDPTKMKEATDRIKSVFLGLALLLGSFLILHTINPELTVLRPVVFDPGAAFPLCETDNDCEENHKCSKVEGQDEGICILKPARIETGSCDYITLYSKIDFAGTRDKIKNNEREEFEARSARRWIRNEDGELVESGLCSLKLYKDETFSPGWDGCKGYMRTVTLPNRDLFLVVPEAVKCVRGVPRGFKLEL